MECQICYEHFDSRSFIPKILVKCGHSFCKVCLERIVNKKTNVQCPVCRENTKLGKNDNLPTNYSLCEIIENSSDKEVKNLLEKYKYFDDRKYKHVVQTIIRAHDPRKLALKKIYNNDFIYVEEFEVGQNYSLFTNLPKRNRRYDFNPNSIFSFIFNEQSPSISIYRKASKCRHSYSCFEHLLKKVFYSVCVSMLSKYPLQFIIKFIFNKFGNSCSESINKYTSSCQIMIGVLFGLKEIFGCMAGFYIDQYYKITHW